MTDHQIKKYLEVRSVEIKMDDRKKLFKGKGGAGGGDDIGSVYRAFSRMVCNFAFPDEINRVFPNDVRVLMKKELKDMANVDSDNGDDMEPNKRTAPFIVSAQDRAPPIAPMDIRHGAGMPTLATGFWPVMLSWIRHFRLFLGTARSHWPATVLAASESTGRRSAADRGGCGA
jgi:hypothetical protein